MSWTRRHFLQTGGAAAAAAGLPTLAHSENPSSAVLKPRRLKKGDLVGLINPAGATFHPDDAEIARETMAALGLKVRFGKHLLDRYGYLAGRDKDRAADVNDLFADPGVRALISLRGGWGCARLLGLLDYDMIRKNPKIIMGYSDLTALLLAINAKTGLVTFHGPVGISTWNEFSTGHVQRLLFEAKALEMHNPTNLGDNLVQVENRVLTITPGKARGRLQGGNLAVLTGMIGSDYLPDFSGSILFLEEVGEAIYRVDRMLTQLKLAGVLDQIAGLVFGRCSDCKPGKGYGSLTLEEVLSDHIAPLGIPAWYGSMIGHIEDKFTIPLGVEAEINADSGTIKLLEPAVV